MIHNADPTARLSLHLLELDGAIIAGLSVACGSQVNGIKTFFDDRYRRYAPGHLLRHLFVEAAASDPSIEAIDFYTTMTYADAFANGHRPYRDLAIWHCHRRARMVRAGRMLVNRIRRRPTGILPR